MQRRVGDAVPPSSGQTPIINASGTSRLRPDWDAARRLLAGLNGGVNIADAALDRHVRRGGDRPALLSLALRERRLSYAQLAEQSARLAAVLAARGVVPGDKVAVLTGRSVELYVSAFGCWKAGAVFCPLFSAFGPGPLKSRLELSRAKLLIATEDLYRRKVAGLRSLLPELTHVLLVGEDGHTVVGADGEDFHAALAAARPADPATAADAPVFLHFTSGTTGTPRARIPFRRHRRDADRPSGVRPGPRRRLCAPPIRWITNTAYAQIAPGQRLHGGGRRS